MEPAWVWNLFKDVIITLCGLYNRGEVLNAAVEFAGPGVAALTTTTLTALAAKLLREKLVEEEGVQVGYRASGSQMHQGASPSATIDACPGSCSGTR